MITISGSQAFIGFIYLVASGLFILALKWMNAPPTARRGILSGEIGMVLAIGGTILQLGIEGKLEHIAIDYTWILVALGIGTAIGIIPGTTAYIYLGTILGDVAQSTHRTRTPAEWAIYICGFIATTAVCIYLVRAAKRALARHAIAE